MYGNCILYIEVRKEKLYLATIQTFTKDNRKVNPQNHEMNDIKQRTSKRFFKLI